MKRHLFLFLILLNSLAACRQPETRVVSLSELAPAAAASTPTPEPAAAAPSPTPLPGFLAATLGPDDDTSSLLPDRPLVIHFNQPMDTGAPGQPITLSPSTAGRFSWSADATRLTFTPDHGLRPNTTYRLTLHRRLRSASGLAFDERPLWRFTTADVPMLRQRTPSGETVTDRQPEIRLRFNQPMDPESVLAALSIDPPVPFSHAWEGMTLVLTPRERLAYGVGYQFALADTAVSTAGLPLIPASWRYRLADPAARLLQGGGSGAIRISFNYAVDPASARSALQFDPPIVGDLSWDAAGTVATFAPAALLPPSTRYTLQFSGTLRDAFGDPLPTPAPATFTTPPPVLSTQPSGHDANPRGSVRITFDRLIDEAAAAAGFSITPPVTGTIRWDETTLIFEPGEDGLAPHTRYTVTLDTAVTGRDGETLFLQPYSYSFTTGTVQKIASFGWGPNAQVLDANGRRAVQFTVSDAALPDVSFDLHQLTLPQFLDRYASGFRDIAGWETLRPIATDSAPLVGSWAADTDGATVGGYNHNVRETRIPNDIPPGLYVINVNVGGRLDDQLILVLSSYTAVAKQAENQVVAWVTDVNGDPVPAAEVAVYARSGSLIAQGTADAGGVFRADLDRDPEPLILVAGVEADRTAVGFTWEWGSDYVYGFNWWRPRPETQDTAVHLYTERPIYQPGQTVFFKGVIRRDDDAILSLLPAGTAVTARMRDARNNVVQTLALETNDFGSVHGSFALAEGAMLGDYAVELSIPAGPTYAESTHRQTFKVQEYRKPDYEVLVGADAAAYVTGDRIAVTVDSRYFFGEPVANADVVVSVYNVTPSNWWEDPTEARDFTWYRGYREPLRGRTDENGRLTLSLTAEASGSYQYYNAGEWGSNVSNTLLGIEATVDDGSHQTASGHVIVRVASAAERVSVDAFDYFQQPDRPFTLAARVLTIHDAPVAGRALAVSLRRWSSGSGNYTQVIQSAQMTTDAAGRASLPLTIAEPGYYQIRVTGRDARGNDIGYNSWVAAFSDGGGFWGGGGGQLRVTADRDSYAPGDAAQLLIESAFAGPALLSFERGTTRRTQLVQLTPPLTAVSVAIQPDDAPNIYVTVNAWEAQDTTLQENMWSSLADSQLYRATVELVVPVTDKSLTVTITPDRDTYGPRDEATVTVRVTNARGEPVSAELSLGLVDEAIYALSGELAGPIFDAFYFERANIVRTYDALALTRYLDGGGGGGGGGGDLAASPRADFPDTAAWFPILQTDWNGEATVTITLPDSLTRWRLTAKAATADTQVGEATAAITTTQDVLIRPILPRVLTAGDNVQLTALIHNNGPTRQTVNVELALDAAQWTIGGSGAAWQLVTIPAGEVRAVGWTTTARAAGETELTLTATIGGETADAIRLPLTIQPLAVPDVATQVGQFRGELSTAVDVPAGALPQSSVRIELSRSIAGSLLEGLQYLTGFPYGCVEQTMSRALPNAVVGRAFFQLGIGSATLQADLPAQINASLQRLYGYQHNDGGWGWWYDDSSHDYQTAWVLFGLATIRDAGYEVDQGVIDRGVQWLNDNLDGMDARTRAYALYSMAVAGQPNAAATTALLAQVDELDTFSRAGLALALDALGQRAAAVGVLDALRETAVATDTGLVYWSGSGEDGHYYQKTMASATRSSALALSAFAQIQPGGALEAGIVRYLMGQRQSQGWGTTNETSYAILGLTDHLLASSFSEAAAATGYAVELNGETIASGTLGRGAPAVSLVIPAEQLRAGANALRITQSGSGQLYYTINSRMLVAETSIAPAGAVTVRREYRSLNGQPLTRVQAGDLVRVQLTVNLPRDASYVLVEDRLPGGLEALNSELNNTSHVATLYEWEEPIYFWQEYGYNYKEIRADRVSFFITDMSSGRRTFSYVARAAHAGQFVALPAEVSAMYDPTTWGRSGSGQLEVTP